MKFNQNIALFEAFTEGIMSEDELNRFEARLIYESEFKMEYEKYLVVEKGIKQHYRTSLKSKFQEIDNQLDSRSLNKNNKPKSFFIWSSSVAAAIVIGVLLFNHFSTIANQDNTSINLVANYWPHEEGLPVKMSSKGTYDDAMNSFKVGEWDKAEKTFSKIASDTANYFLGIISYEQKNYLKSAAYFKKIDAVSVYYQKANFRLALIYILNNNKGLAKDILQSQVDLQTEFTVISKEILSKIQ